MCENVKLQSYTEQLLSWKWDSWNLIESVCNDEPLFVSPDAANTKIEPGGAVPKQEWAETFQVEVEE